MSGKRKGLCHKGFFPFIITLFFIAVFCSISYGKNEVNLGLVGKWGNTGDVLSVEIYHDNKSDRDYILCGRGTGFVIFDATDPNLPIEKASLKITSYDIELYNYNDSERIYALLANGENGLSIIDITDLNSPIYAGKFDTSGSARSVAISGNYACIADGSNGLVIIDITDPAIPTYAGGIDTDGYAQGVAISGNYTYIADGSNGLVIIDITDPTNPLFFREFYSPGDVRGVAISGNYAYLVGRGLIIMDISDPTDPIYAGEVSTGGTTNDVAISGNYAYLAAAFNKLLVINITDPTAPTLEEVIFNIPGMAHRIAISGSFAYVASRGNILSNLHSGLSIFDITDPVAPTYTGGVDTSGFAKSLSISENGNYAYIPFLDSGLMIVDITNPEVPAYTGGFDTPGLAYCVDTSGNYAYVADHENGLVIIDITDPEAPAYTGGFDTPGWADNVCVSGNYAYVADRVEGLAIIDISDPTNPAYKGGFDTPGDAWSVTISENYAYIADYGNGLVIVDISDPTNPAYTGGYNTPGAAQRVAISGNYAYIADYTNGLVIIDITDPTNPTYVGKFDALESALDVAISGNYAYVEDGYNGLIVIIDISDQTNPTCAGRFDSHGAVTDITISGNYAYVAAGYNGLSIFRIIDTSTTQGNLILFSGGPAYATTNPFWPPSQALANLVYSSFIDQGYPQYSIYYVNPNPNQDINKDGTLDPMVVDDFTPTVDDIKYAITDWALNQLNTGPLYIYLIGQGAEDQFQIMPGQMITAGELRDCIDNFRNGYTDDQGVYHPGTDREVLVILESIASDTFIDDLTGDDITVITSDGDGPSYTDVDVMFMDRVPNYPYDASKNTPEAGDTVTFVAHVKIPESPYLPMLQTKFIWFMDGIQIGNGIVYLEQGQDNTVSIDWIWDNKRHEIMIVFDPENSIIEQSEENNILYDFTDALIVGIAVEKGLVEAFPAFQRDLGIESLSFEDWFQRQIKIWNMVLMEKAGEMKSDTLLDIQDRVRGVISYHEDGSLMGGNCPLVWKDVDMLWGKLASDIQGYSESKWAWFYEGSLPHELSHARYLPDTYILDLGASCIEIIDDSGYLVTNTQYMPPFSWNVVYYNKNQGMMSADYAGRYSIFNAYLLNRIAGARAQGCNTNGCCSHDTDWYAVDFPESMFLKILHMDSSPWVDARLDIYTRQGTYGNVKVDNIIDYTLFTDSDGRALLPANVFTNYSQEFVLKISSPNGSQREYRFVERTDFHMAFWGGAKDSFDYIIRTDFDPVPVADKVENVWGHKRGETFDLTFKGRNFKEGGYIRFSNSEVVCNSISYISENEVRVNITLPENNVRGSIGFRLYNPDGKFVRVKDPYEQAINITFENTKPYAIFTAYDIGDSIPGAYYFNGLWSYDWGRLFKGIDGPLPLEGTGPIASYEWDFGDGSTYSYEPYTIHNYINPGTYNVTLTVTDMDGEKASITETIVLNGQTFYRDGDEDGYGDASESIQAFIAPEGYVEYSTDCDDTDPNTYLGASEIFDGRDNDCDGEIPSNERPVEGKWYVNPGESIQARINLAQNGEIIIVHPGTYIENINFLGKAITVRSIDPNDPDIVASTIIDGNQVDCVINFSNGEDPNSVLKGMTIQNGAGRLYGGGILCDSSHPSIINCVISGNSASNGSGIACLDLYPIDLFSPRIINCIISGNSAWNGGGIFCDSSSPRIINCNISGNSADNCGGGIDCQDSSPIITNCTISENSDDGIYCVYYSSPIITNCTISANFGDGISCKGACSPYIRNCTISANSEDGIYCVYDPTQFVPNSSPQIINSIIWGNRLSEISCNTATIFYSCIKGGYGDPNATYNIDCNPQFIDPNAGDYHLQPTSCCIDAGNNNDCPSEDKDGITRPQDGNGDDIAICDMGAYEYPEIHCTYTISSTEAAFDSSGGTGIITVTAPWGCSWEVLNNDPEWITITSGSSGSGTGSVNYTVEVNLGSEERTGTINIAGKTFLVKQGIRSCNAVRSVPGYTPGYPVTITIEVSPDAQTSAYAVEETPPEGWQIDTNSINQNGEWDSVNKKVKWGPFFDNSSRTLTYKVEAPCSAPVCNPVSGTASFNGADQSICGDGEICEGPKHPADTNGDWRITINEVTGYGSAWKKGEVWSVGPNPIQINYVTNAGFIWKKGEFYHYVPEILPPLCWQSSVTQPCEEPSVTQPAARKRETQEEPILSYSFDPNSYIPGQPVTVTIEVTPSESTIAYALEDGPPEGWQVDSGNINYSGAWDSVNKKVKWGPFFDNDQRAFTYIVTPPPGESGIKDFHGVFSPDGGIFDIKREIAKDICDKEICDGKDNDCDGVIDDPDELPYETYYHDGDYDGYGDPNDSLYDCRQPEGYISNAEDCNDNDPNAYPGASELCDGIDNNCDGIIDRMERACSTKCGTGVETCMNGQWVDCSAPSLPCPCLFTAEIKATGQLITGLEDYVSKVQIGIDTDAYTLKSPPFPPPDYTVILNIAGEEENYKEDIRAQGPEEQEWRLNMTIGETADPIYLGYFPVLSWDTNEICPPDPNTGYLRLYSEDAQGVRTLLISDMSQTGQYQTQGTEGQYISGEDIYIFTYYIVWSRCVPVVMNFQAGWSMVSLPVEPPDPTLSELFRDAEVMYSFERASGYVRVLKGEKLQAGKGYWILFNKSQSYEFCGKPIHSYSIPVYGDGWEMIGGCTSKARPVTDSYDIEVIYGYMRGSGYERVLDSEYIEPGRGYWILLEGIVDQCLLTVKEILPLSRLRTGSDSIVYKSMDRSVPQDNIWTLVIKATGQGGDSSSVGIGIDPDGQAYPYPPFNPPGFSVVLKIKGDGNWYYGEDLRTPGPEQKIWELSVMVGGEQFGGDVDANQPGFFPVLSWDPNEIGPAQLMDLRLGDANGPVLLDMRTSNTYQTLQADADEYLPADDYASFSFAVVLMEAPLTYCRDADGDGYGNPDDAIQYEAQQDLPPGYVQNCGDCNDSDSTMYPDAPELCDGKDNDCDGSVPAAETKDADGDGFVACNDCNDNNPEIYPGAPELCDGKDNNCDQTIPFDESDIDRDGFFICEGDCDDTDNNVYPGAPELCDGKDDNCNGIGDDADAIVYSNYYLDSDGDGLGDPNNSLYDCKQPEGYVPNSNDYDDTYFDDSYYPFWYYDLLLYYGSSEMDYLIIEKPFILIPLLNGSAEIDNISQNWPDDYCYFMADLIVDWESDVLLDQTAYVELGLVGSDLEGIIINPENWSEDLGVRLQLIDVQQGETDITDPNTFTEANYIVADFREPSGQAEIMWYVLVEISEEGNSNASDYYPVLSWDPNDFKCIEANHTKYDYQLLRGLGSSGIVLVDNMADAGSYQTSSQDGELVKYFTILGTKEPEEKEEEDDEGTLPKTSKQIFPWPGTITGGLGWSGFPQTIEFFGGLPSPVRSGYPPGLSIPSFPGAYTGFTYPGGMYNAQTSFVPRFPSKFPVIGIFSPVGRGWHGNYWTGYPLPSLSQTGWFYTY
ncbi:MAG: MopE-related protein [bacterium]